MFQSLLDLRLRIIDACNTAPAGEQETTAAAWIGILDLESSSLADGSAEWPTDLASVSMDERARGRRDARLALIIADELVAALLRGHLSEEFVS